MSNLVNINTMAHIYIYIYIDNANRAKINNNVGWGWRVAQLLLRLLCNLTIWVRIPVEENFSLGNGHGEAAAWC